MIWAFGVGSYAFYVECVFEDRETWEEPPAPKIQTGYSDRLRASFLPSH